MSRQTQLHLLPQDVNLLVAAMHDREPLEVALRSGTTAEPERLAFIGENVSGQVLVLWSNGFASNLQRHYIVKAQPPYYLFDEQADPVIELSVSKPTKWQGRPALTQGRIYAVLDDKPPAFAKCYERIIRYIRKNWRKNPAASLGGYVGPSASDWFNKGGLLLPSFIPPVRSDWIERLVAQHPQ